jgi:TP901 family phage tail tape measure protein
MPLDLKVLLGYVDQSGRGFSQTESRLDSLANKAAGVGRVMTAVGAAITGTMMASLTSAARYGDEIAKAAQITGVAVEELSKLRFAAEQSGLEFGALQMSLRGMQRSAAEAADGMEQYEQAYERVGVSVKKADGTIKSAEELINDLADGFSKMEEGTLKAATAQEIFGGRGVALLTMLNQGSEGVKELTERAEELGIVWDKDAAQAAERYNDALNEVKLAAQGLGQTLVTTLGPGIAEAAENFAEAIASFREWADEHPKLAEKIIKASFAIGIAFGVGGPILMALPFLINGLRMVIGWFTRTGVAATQAAAATEVAASRMARAGATAGAAGVAGVGGGGGAIIPIGPGARGGGRVPGGGGALAGARGAAGRAVPGGAGILGLFAVHQIERRQETREIAIAAETEKQLGEQIGEVFGRLQAQRRSIRRRGARPVGPTEAIAPLDAPVMAQPPEAVFPGVLGVETFAPVTTVPPGVTPGSRRHAEAIREAHEARQAQAATNIPGTLNINLENGEGWFEDQAAGYDRDAALQE